MRRLGSLLPLLQYLHLRAGVLQFLSYLFSSRPRQASHTTRTPDSTLALACSFDLTV